jgi:hypothetical protein
MKTAMQELEDKLKDNLKWIVMNADYQLMDKLFIEGLEKEKEQICNAYVDGLEGIYMASEQYYNQTYKEDKITINQTKRSIEGIGLNNQKK